MHHDPQLTEAMQGLSVAVDRMCRVVDEIVLTSRLATGKVEVRLVNMAPRDVIQHLVLNFMAACHQRQLNLTLVEPDQWPPVFSVDPELMTLAISNVLGNAIKYTPDGGTVLVNVTQVGKRVRISIHDSGIGIDPAEHERIFDRFYSAHDIQLHSSSKTAFMGSGPGLGLAIAKTIIEAHRGSIRVESTGMDAVKLPGSIFYIELPLRLDEADATPARLEIH